MDRSSSGEHLELPAWEFGFHFKSDRLCLAFCATVGERWRRSFERLRSPEDLGRWLRQAGLVSAPPVPSERSLSAARVLREAIYRSVRAAMSGRPIKPVDRRQINRWAARPDLVPQLGPGGKCQVATPPRVVEACLATVARDAIELLSSGDIDRVRECAAPDCALLFFDRSRPGKRRWCADSACGTRIRTANYRQRRRPPVTDPNQP